MTFQSDIDVWGPEGLRTRTSPRLSAREVIRLALLRGWMSPSIGATHAIALDRVTSGLTRSWRDMLSRKIDWACVRLDSTVQVVDLCETARRVALYVLNAEQYVRSDLQQEVSSDVTSCF
jgi:hypothetical protein